MAIVGNEQCECGGVVALEMPQTAAASASDAVTLTVTAVQQLV